MIAILAALVLGYLLGSIPFGLVLTRAAGLGDIRAIGSGNIGATNVLRTGRKGLALATFLGDALKGTVAILAARWFAGEGAAMAAAVGAFLGHVFPVWLGFKGGKGVATYIGCLLGLYWPAALAFCAVWLAMAFTFRISSLSALTASVVVPLGLFLGGWASGPLTLVLVALAALVWFRHKENILRLLAGTEPKIKGKKSGG
ncbi:glycerol-3-phosphate 1-O-acyltransferase PlsY [Pinisolibacter aquiterrae]|uniref:glycerol-3-phosphate 1-O-acyltransferase PlsY n=1 Tax=Pinisolibacter aquiterrae TaxID=2815579 RepID=UPI001C3D9194|nr:glycerol-3-phosphate 1-O-acyltransferase PlsY [Pinisolibacter aquiterrae]MBV5263977.1 glycerol-3-phosphate 1-O-acyltransferase PlsY [Pinisolibacter aquiterrae]MCC8233928.1 glycerol-3-phosphate 1-O-acyltransferase PlsY [Pinisolibacter aquiterrae]